MAKNITEEQMTIIRRAIKENDYMDIYGDVTNSLDLSLSVSRNVNKYRFSTLNQYFDEAIADERLRSYKINLVLEDLDAGKELAKIAYAEIRIIPLSAMFGDIDLVIDEDADSSDSISPLLNLKEINMSEVHEEYWYAKYPSSRINIGELHTFYISPEFRGLGIADFIYSKLNDLLYAEYNQVVYLLGVYVNPFKTQSAIEEMDMDNLEYCHGKEVDEKVLQAMYRSLEKSDFHPMGSDGRHFYKNMFDDDLYEYVDEEDFD